MRACLRCLDCLRVTRHTLGRCLFLRQQVAHTHAQKAQALLQRRALQALAGGMANGPGIAGVERQAVVSGGDAEIGKAQLDPNRSPYIALALQVGSHTLAQLGKDRAQFRPVTHRVQVTVERGLAAH
ncbi:hypothetical protein D3C72_1979460 [compost metagenome]